MDLKYGERTYELQLAERHLAGVIKVTPPVPAEPPETLIERALNGCAAQMEKIGHGERVVIITSDITRYTGSEIYLPLLVERLNRAGVTDDDIAIVIALGIHRKQTEAEHRKILGPLYGRIRVADHECDDPGKLVTLGFTNNGIEVEINR